MLYDNYDALKNFCISLGLSDNAIKKIYTTRNFRVLNASLDNDSLTYVESRAALNGIKIPKGASVLVREEHSFESQFDAIIVDNPRFIFWSLYEFVERSKEFKHHSQISNSCTVGSNTIISKLGVIIEDDVVIDDCVVIKPGVVIKRGSKIGPGCVLGSDGFEVKDTIFGKIVISHKGGVVIEENVEIGALCSINQGLGDIATQIGTDTKIDCGVHIAHSCFIGPRNVIAANVTFGGRVKTGSDVFLGLNSTIKNGVKLADGCYIGASSFVSESYGFAVKLIPRAAKPLPL
jgi:UDP-3-O-[3-hydroxymyristoyl] glucosamine N-acyltransferase